MSTRSDFLTAWEKWDESCALAARKADEKKAREGDDYRPHATGPSPSATKAMETAAIRYAATLHLPTSVLRSLLADWRGAGMDRERALTAVEAGMKV